MSKNIFKRGDEIKYIKEAPEEAGMTVSIGITGMCEIENSGNIVVNIDGYKIPLIGVCDITDCFQLVNKPIMKKQKRELKFYTKEEELDMRKALEEGMSPKEYANKYAEALGRPVASVMAKMTLLGKKEQNSKFTHQQETILKHCLFRGDDKKCVIEKYSKEWNLSKQAIAVKLNWLAGNITKSAAEEQEQGMIFEGVPTKVVLFSDHFRVYF